MPEAASLSKRTAELAAAILAIFVILFGWAGWYISNESEKSANKVLKTLDNFRLEVAREETDRAKNYVKKSELNEVMKPVLARLDRQDERHLVAIRMLVDMLKDIDRCGDREKSK